MMSFTDVNKKKSAWKINSISVCYFLEIAMTSKKILYTQLEVEIWHEMCLELCENDAMKLCWFDEIILKEKYLSFNKATKLPLIHIEMLLSFWSHKSVFEIHHFSLILVLNKNCAIRFHCIVFVKRISVIAK